MDKKIITNNIILKINEKIKQNRYGHFNEAAIKEFIQQYER
jgi:hypothetical protein